MFVFIGRDTAHVLNIEGDVPPQFTLKSTPVQHGRQCRVFLGGIRSYWYNRVFECSLTVCVRDIKPSLLAHGLDSYLNVPLTDALYSLVT